MTLSCCGEPAGKVLQHPDRHHPTTSWTTQLEVYLAVGYNARLCIFERQGETVQAYEYLFPYDLQETMQLKYVQMHHFTDWSDSGAKGQSTWKLITHASIRWERLNDSISRLKWKQLGTTCACKKSSSYILGKSFLIQTDHKTLLPFLGTKHLDSVPPQTLRFHLQLASLTISSHMYRESICILQTHFQEHPPQQWWMALDSKRKQKH